MLQTMDALATIFQDLTVVEKLRKTKDANQLIEVISTTGVTLTKTITAKNIMNENVISIKENQT